MGCQIMSDGAPDIRTVQVGVFGLVCAPDSPVAMMLLVRRSEVVHDDGSSLHYSKMNTRWLNVAYIAALLSRKHTYIQVSYLGFVSELWPQNVEQTPPIPPIFRMASGHAHSANPCSGAVRPLAGIGIIAFSSNYYVIEAPRVRGPCLKLGRLDIEPCGSLTIFWNGSVQ